MLTNNNKITKIILLLFLCLCLSCGGGTSADSKNAHTSTPPARIISFAPSITEILYELDLGDAVQGVTRFCNYPPIASQKSKVGGHADYNYEMILRLKPDLAVILKEQRDLAVFLDKYEIKYISVGSDSVDEIIESALLIANACMVKDRGEALAQKLRLSVEDVYISADTVRPKVLLCVGRENIGSGAVNQCYAAGALSFYHQIIEIAGGINVLGDARQAYPAIGAEAVIRLNPDIIIDISSAYSDRPMYEICSDWSALKSVAAVKDESVHCLQGSYLTIPGPRFVLILEKFREIFRQQIR